MFRAKCLAFFLIFLVNVLGSIQAQGQTTITFTEFPLGADASESYADKGVLFSSFYGKPTMTKDGVFSQRKGLCAYGRRTVMGIPVSVCENLQITFVSPKQKMINNFASGIKMTFIGGGGVTAYWYDEDGKLHQSQAVYDANRDLSISIPTEVDVISLFTTDRDCAACGFMITSLSYTLSKSADPICDRPATDAGFSYRRLINEDYPEVIYERLDEYRRPGRPLEIGLQYLKRGERTYYDEYAIIVKFSPEDEERNIPLQIFKAMRSKLDTVGIGDAAKDFRDAGEFDFFEPSKINSRKGGLPIVGDIYRINIWSIDNGDVMITNLVEQDGSSRFRYSTLNNDLPKASRPFAGSGSHPNNGSREFGYHYTVNGWTKFYVRGIHQFYVAEYQAIAPKTIGAATLLGKVKQDKLWLSLLRGIGNLTEFYGGRIIYPATKTINEDLSDVPKCHVPPRKGYGR